MKTKDSVQLSLEKSKTVCGYQVRRLSLGEYLAAMEAVKAASKTLLHACFPGLDMAQAMGRLKTIDAAMLTRLMLRLMDTAPKEAVKLLSVLTGVDEKDLLTDENIGLDGAAQMLEAFWELNDLENFISAARRMAAKIKNLRGKTGCSG